MAARAVRNEVVVSGFEWWHGWREWQRWKVGDVLAWTRGVAVMPGREPCERGSGAGKDNGGHRWGGMVMRICPVGLLIPTHVLAPRL